MNVKDFQPQFFGHAFPLEILARKHWPIRTATELQAMAEELGLSLDRPMASGVKPHDPELTAKRKRGRKAWQAAGRVAAAEKN